MVPGSVLDGLAILLGRRAGGGVTDEPPPVEVTSLVCALTTAELDVVVPVEIPVSALELGPTSSEVFGLEAAGRVATDAPLKDVASLDRDCSLVELRDEGERMEVVAD